MESLAALIEIIQFIIALTYIFGFALIIGKLFKRKKPKASAPKPKVVPTPKPKVVTKKLYDPEPAEVIKGKHGENEIETILLQMDKRIHKQQIIKNLYLKKENGKTTEIDLILILQNKVFVFESKNYKGLIFGNSRYKYWTQTFGNDKKFKLYNPIWQNLSHIKALKRKFINYPDFKYYSIIAFGYDAMLMDIKNNNADTYVINYEDIAQTIKGLTKNKDFVLSENIIELIEKINKYVKNSKHIKLEHIKNYNELKIIMTTQKSR